MIAKFAQPALLIVREMSATMFRASSACWRGRLGRSEGTLPVRAMPVQSGPFIFAGRKVVWKERVCVGKGIVLPSPVDGAGEDGVSDIQGGLGCRCHLPGTAVRELEWGGWRVWVVGCVTFLGRVHRYRCTSLFTVMKGYRH
jgi:hypothetical protein